MLGFKQFERSAITITGIELSEKFGNSSLDGEVAGNTWNCSRHLGDCFSLPHTIENPSNGDHISCGVFTAGVASEIFSKHFKTTLPPAGHVIAVNVFLFLVLPFEFFFFVVVQAIFLFVFVL
jgi:hypothetical protein